MYEQLIEQFENLSDEEKNALIVYKTRLGLLINSLDNNPDYKFYYDRYMGIINDPVNAFVSKIVFKYIDMSSIDCFKESINKIKTILDDVTSKIVLPEPTTVYRSVSTDDSISDISKGNIVSTTLSFGEALKYAVAGDNIAIYEITLPEGSPCAICRYAIVEHLTTGRLSLSKSDDEEEIIINRDLYDLDISEEYDNDGLTFRKGKASIKEKVR